MTPTFIRTNSGRYVNAVEIVSFRQAYVESSAPVAPGEKKATIPHGFKLSLRDGTVEYTYVAMDKLGVVVPAVPGFSAVHFVVCADGNAPVTDQVFLTPIIAWRITVEGDVFPIVAEDSGAEPDAVLLPDGRVEIAHDATYDDLAAFVADKRKPRR